MRFISTTSRSKNGEKKEMSKLSEFCFTSFVRIRYGDDSLAQCEAHQSV